jgi:tetratricopeptide (TPR) repeat protein
VAYWLGAACEALGDKAGAARHWQDAARDIPAIGDDDVLPTTDRSVLLYYQGLALRRLGQPDKARALFAELVKSGQATLQKEAGVNFFAKFGNGPSERSRQATARYLSGLGYLGQGQVEAAKGEFTLALQASPDHLGAKNYQDLY